MPWLILSAAMAAHSRLRCSPATLTANWSDLGFTGRANVRDLWTHTQIANQADGFSATLPPHGARLLRVSP